MDPLQQVITNSCISQNPSCNAEKCVHSITVAYPGFPFPPYTPLYPPYDHVQAYLHSFASRFELYPYIHFNHSLESAHWVGNASKGFWELSISTEGPRDEIIPHNKTLAHNLRRSSQITRHFDHLVVANGQDHYPSFPAWATDAVANEWLRNGRGRRFMHSIYFREPDEFAGKIILVVGAGGSGADIVIQCSGHAKKVCLRIHRLRGRRRWLTAILSRCITPSLVTGQVHPRGRFPVQSTNPKRRVSPPHQYSLKTVRRFPTSKSSSLLQDTITGFRSWTRRILIINLQWRSPSMVDVQL